MENEQNCEQKMLTQMIDDFEGKYDGILYDPIKLKYDIPKYAEMMVFHKVLSTDVSYIGQILDNYLMKSISNRKLDEREALELNNISMEIVKEALCLWKISEMLLKEKDDESQTTLEQFI